MSGKTSLLSAKPVPERVDVIRFTCPTPAIVCMITDSPTSPENSLTLTRSRRTTIRWLVRRTSSSSEEMKRHDLPSSARAGPALDLGLGADVDAARRLVEDEQPAGSSPASARGCTFCWLPPLEVRTGLVRASASRCRSSSMYLSAIASCSGGLRDRSQPRRGLDGQDDVLAHGQVVDDALGLAVLRAEGHARGRSSRSASGARRACRRRSIVPLSGLSTPNSRPASLGAAGAEQAGQPDDLARVQLEVERLDRAGPAEPGWPAGRTSPVPCWLVASLIFDMSSSSVRFRPSILAISSKRGRACGAYVPTSRPLRRTVIRSATRRPGRGSG